MVRDNWQLKANFKLPPKTILYFEKKNKRSVFFIEESMINTRVEVWMIPTQDEHTQPSPPGRGSKLRFLLLDGA